jgi:hypothetical protein
VHAEKGEDVKPVGSSWFHRDLVTPKIDSCPLEKKFAPREAYDSTARNPAYAGGEKAFFVELHTLSKHFHPTVALFSKKILAGKRRISYISLFTRLQLILCYLLCRQANVFITRVTL